jgi:hypothetical protein
MRAVLKAQTIRLFLAVAAISSSALVLEAGRRWH